MIRAAAFQQRRAELRMLALAAASARLAWAAPWVMLPACATCRDSASLPALITAITIVLWAFSRLPEYLTALLFFSAVMIFAVASRDVVLSGFSSAAFRLVLSGYVLGLALKYTGLADRMAGALSRRLSGSYPKVVAGVDASA
ncbi:SLC13 family permease [Achromobacter xylosoxidans]